MFRPSTRSIALFLTLSFLVGPALAEGPTDAISVTDPCAGTTFDCTTPIIEDPCDRIRNCPDDPEPCEIVNPCDPDPCAVVNPCEPEPCISLQTCPDPCDLAPVCDPDPCEADPRNCEPDPCEVDPKSCEPCEVNPQNCDPCEVNPQNCEPDPCREDPKYCHPDPCPPGSHCEEKPPCGCPSENYTIELNTGTTSGVKNAYGTMDPDWTITSSPFGPVAAYSVSVHPGWAPDSSVATWINPESDGGPSPLPTGTYVYEIGFSLPIGATAFLAVRFSSDDEITFHLQNAANPVIGGHPGPSTWSSHHSFSYAGPGFVAGPNRLVAVSSNSGANVHGIFVEATVYVQTSGTCTVFSKDMSTGTNPGSIPLGSADPDWYTVTYPTQTTFGPFPAYAITSHPGWVNAPPAQYISPFGGGTGANNPAPSGNYVFAIDFYLECQPRCDNIVLDLDFTADDDVELILNGLPLTSEQDPGSPSLHHITYQDCRGFLFGLNHLYAYVENGPTYVGFLARGTLTVTA